MIAYIILPIFLLIPIGIYLYFYFLRIADFWGIKLKSIQIKIASIFLTLLAVIFSANLFGVGALIIFHIVAVALCMEILNFIFVALHKKKGIKINIWNKLFRCGFIPIIIASMILGYGYYNMKNVVKTDYTVHTRKAIRDQGYKIAMISDLHFGTTMNEKELMKYCKEIEDNKPDIVALCGDIVDERTNLLQMKNAAKLLGNIKSTYGTYYIYGNHDKATYSATPSFDENQLKNELERNGVHVLQDEIYKVNGELTIIGRKDKGFSSEINRKTSKELLQNADVNNFLLLLDHQPSELKQNSLEGIDLQLSGHTHAGQIWPEGLFNKVLGIGELNYGYKRIGNYQIIVSSGIGGWGYPIRTGSHSEYVIVNVKR
ncbi:metallophosphoesterase [Clostridium sp. 19966]|uniref:metallophosphoesterase n=1 Tax=Clostridium sp. 19966 TaxID=2768166 RepID=UPI0028DE6F61|nr:metallophosphoesterase [Clostridium sp. 19966]MDT8719015.1 metallophosphoesterase [Clostridium sp. 19966]